MKKIVKFTLLLIVMIICIGVTACDNEEEGDKIKIKFYTKSFEKWADDYLKQAVKEYNRTNTDNIEVSIKIYMTNDDYNSALSTGIENNTAPDTYLLSYPNLSIYADAEYLIPVTKYLTEEEQAKYYDAAKSNVVLNDDYYLFPWYTEPSTVFYYRKDIFKSYGLTAPETIDDLYEICRVLEPTLNNGQYALGLPVKSGDLSGFTWGLQYNFTGGLALTDDWLSHRLDNEGYKELANFFYNCVKNKWTSADNLTTDGYANLVTALCRKEPACVMAISGSWQISEIYEKYPDYLDKIGLCKMPTLEKNADRTSSTNGGWGFAISSQSSQQKQDAAAKFIKWLTLDDDARSAEYFEIEHMAKFPANQKAVEYIKTNNFAEINQEWFNIIEEISSKSIKEAAYGWDVNFAVGTMFEEVILAARNGAKFDDAFTTAHRTALSKVATTINQPSWQKNPYYKEGN